MHHDDLQVPHRTSHVHQGLPHQDLRTYPKVCEVYLQTLRQVLEMLARMLGQVCQVLEHLQHLMWYSLPRPSWLCVHLPTQALWPWLILSIVLFQLWIQVLHQDAQG